VPCKHCGTQTGLKTELPPIGYDPGHLIYECPRCKRYTWVAWQKLTLPRPHVEQPVQLQQQQAQPQSKDDTDKK